MRRMLRLFLALGCLGAGFAHGAERQFSVRDSIGLQQFVDPDGDGATQVAKFSPDGKHFIVVTRRGLLAQDRVESTLWMFDVTAARAFLRTNAAQAVAPPAVPLVTMAGVTRASDQTSEAVAITAARWSPDGRRVLFLARDDTPVWRLYEVSISTRAVRQLTPAGQDVAAYATNGESIVYAVSIPLRAAPPPREIVATGMGLAELLTPDWRVSYPNQNELWVLGPGAAHRVIDPASGSAVRLNQHFDRDSVILSPSPDGRYVVIAQAVDAIPKAWEGYQAGAGVGRISAVDSRELTRAAASDVPEHFVLVDLRSGRTRIMVEGPLGRGVNWWTATQVSWSRDGRRVLLANVFLPPDSGSELEKRKRLSAPVAGLYCVASGVFTPVAPFKRARSSDPRSWQVAAVSWDQAAHSMTMKYSAGGPAAEVYQLPSGTRAGAEHRAPTARSATPLAVSIHQGLNSAPTLYASDLDAARSRQVWDPNPALATFDLGEAVVYDWQDDDGHLIKGVLIKPPRFDPARRYPLVIEARAYHQDRFVLDGTYATAVAARAMAADGLLVLQAGEPAAAEQDAFDGATARALRGYEAVIAKLTAEGRIDPDRVGLIGFSRTCDTVLYAITHHSRLFAAATLANGLTYGPLQYLISVDASPVADLAQQQWKLHYDGDAFGSGLGNFLRTNPIFAVASVATPVRIETRGGIGPLNLMMDWEPYAALRSLGKPVDLIDLPYASHVVSMPSDILASQEGELDWMRFWLRGYEDPDATKREQYARWEKLCALQIAEQPRRPHFCRLSATRP